MIEVLVELRKVIKRFGSIEAVRRIDFQVYRGEFLALMGPSGCGKTTTLRMLAGLEEPTEGEILLSGKLMNKVAPHHRDTPMVWQSLALFPFLNVRQNVEFGLKMRGLKSPKRRSKALEWLERLEIQDFSESDVSQLSGGQRQRVALARALVTEPEILLLDEPLSALDAHLVIRMQGVLTRLQRELGITFVYVTHSQSEAFAMANRVIIMDQGKISQIGSAKEIYHAPSNSFVAQFVGRNNILTGKLQISNGSVYAITSLGRFTLPREIETRAPGSDIAFVIGADRVNLSTEQPTNDNYLSCQLISEEFVGSVVTLFLEAADGTEIKAQIQQRELDAINPQPGMNLWASWLTAHAHVLPPIN